jgi:hypothetical protein
MSLRIFYTAALILCISSFASPKECSRVSARPAGQVLPGEEPALKIPCTVEKPLAGEKEDSRPDMEIGEYTPILSALFV